MTAGSAWTPGGGDFDYNATSKLFTEIEEFCKHRACPLSQGLLGGVSQDEEKWAEAVWRIPTADQEYRGMRFRASKSIRGDY
jgi:hypothetical protein